MVWGGALTPVCVFTGSEGFASPLDKYFGVVSLRARVLFVSLCPYASVNASIWWRYMPLVLQHGEATASSTAAEPAFPWSPPASHTHTQWDPGPASTVRLSVTQVATVGARPRGA